MSLVDPAKARAFADSLPDTASTVAEWIHEMADEIESLRRALVTARESERAALADAARLLRERDKS